MRHFFGWLLLLCLLDHDFQIVSNGVSVSVMEGDSVTLNTGVKIKLQEDVKWYFNDICIAQNTEDQNKSKICTDDQCKERFRDRLKLDHQTGSLTIMNTRHTDSGVYKLLINSFTKVFIVSVHGSSGVDSESVSVMEGDSVTLKTGVQTNQQDRIRWYYDYTRIAQINRDQSKICTDVQCNEDTERFRDRLKLDHQTGSLTITHTTNTDAGEYKLWIMSSRVSGKIFIVMVTGDPDPGLSSAAIGGICAAVILIVALIYRSKCTDPDSGLCPFDVVKRFTDVVVWIYNLCTSKCTGNGTLRGDHPQENDVT